MWNIRLRSEAVVNRNSLQATYLEMSFYLATPSSILSHALRSPPSWAGVSKDGREQPKSAVDDFDTFRCQSRAGPTLVRAPQDEVRIIRAPRSNQVQVELYDTRTSSASFSNSADSAVF